MERALGVWSVRTHSYKEMLGSISPHISVPRIHPFALAEQPCRQPGLSAVLMCSLLALRAPAKARSRNPLLLLPAREDLLRQIY